MPEAHRHRFYRALLHKEYYPETIKYMKTASLSYRKKMGQFFTPKSLREELLRKLPRLVRPRILDPSCGTGEFLLSAKEYFVEPELYCWEIDPNLVKIAKRIIPDAHIEQVDALRKPFREEFDVVIGNPPYFEFKPDKELSSKFGEIIYGRTNIYAFFVYLGIKLLKPGGYLAYVVSSSMNNGAYFKKLREFIVRNCDIVYLRVLEDQHIFKEVSHTFQLLVLRKGANSGRYIFRHRNYIIFSEKADYIKKVFKNATTLRDLGYRVQTGKVVWNQNKHLLTNNSKEGILLIWSHNIRRGKLVINNRRDKPQYIKWPIDKADRGPAIVVKRIVGHPRHAVIEAALVPPNTVFVAENHVNVVYPSPNATLEEMMEIVNQLNSEETQKIVRILTGNTQISKTELENLIPLKIQHKRITVLEFLHRRYSDKES